METPLTLNSVMTLLSAFVIVGGGFFFAGRLGKQIDQLAKSVDTLSAATHDLLVSIQHLDRRLTILETRVSGAPEA
jgi:predicted PurR-regulated permease PerM